MMSEQLLYFLRKKPYFFYSFLAVFTSLYSFILALLFFEWSSFQKDVFTVLFGLCIVWFFAFYISFINTKEQFKFEREKEKFHLFEARVVKDFDLSQDENIFKKIEAVQIFVNKNFAKQSLASTRILTLINKTLFLYIDNLSLIKSLEKGVSALSSLVQKNNILQEIKKNKDQNDTLLNLLDSYINELSVKSENNKEVVSIKMQLERMLEILKNMNKK